MLFDRDGYVRRRARQENLVRLEARRGALAVRTILRRLVLRAVCRDRHLSPRVRVFAAQRLRALAVQAAPSRFRRRCRVTGRPRQVLRLAGLARMPLRQQLHERLVPLLAQRRW
jgi:small subunit ribosomal protein S14